MKTKELITLLLLGIALGIFSLIAFRRNKATDAPFNPVPPETPSTGEVSAKPEIDPDAPVLFVAEKNLHSTKQSGQSVPSPLYLQAGENYTCDFMTNSETLGLILTARACPIETSKSGDGIYRQGVNTQREISPAEAPILKVFWEGKQVTAIPLTTYYWQPYYVRVDGNGIRQEMTLQLESPNQSLAAEINKAALFSQDAEKIEGHMRIGASEAALRAQALRRKIVILGLDGLSWKIADPLMQNGRMPNLKKLVDRGIRAELLDEPPLDSPKIWTTIATGVGNETHGILERVVLAEGSNDPIPVNSTLRRKKALWNCFSDFGRQVGFVNWFITWPAEEVNGFIISDRARFESPATIYPELMGRNRSRYLATDADLSLDSSDFAQTVKHFRSLLRTHQYPARFAMEQVEFDALVSRVEEVYFNDCFFRNIGFDCYKRYQPDLFALYFHGTDAISHAFYKFRFPDENFNVSPDQIDSIGDPIENIYAFHDRTLGKLMEMAGPDTCFAIMSDHGFQAQDAEIEKAFSWSLDSVLNALGLLEYSDGKRIDWTRTTANTTRQLEWNPVAYLRVNLKGRESDGIIPEKDFEATLEKIKTTLANVKFEKSDRSVFEIGPPKYERQKERADLLVRPRFQPGDFDDVILMADKRIATRELFSIVPISGTHAIEGILVLAGPGIREGIKLDQYHTVDIAPTLMALAGLPVAEDLEGQVIEEALTPEFLQQVPIRTIASFEPIGRRAIGKEQKTAKVLKSNMDDSIIEIQKRIGYLDQN